MYNNELSNSGIGSFKIYATVNALLWCSSPSEWLQIIHMQNVITDCVWELFMWRKAERKVNKSGLRHLRTDFKAA